MPISTPPCVLSIAGTDPSGGAGIQADIKTISATGSYAASVITALVAQNTQRVDAIFELTPLFLEQQLDAVFSDLDIKAIKIGMLHNKDVIDIVGKYLKNYKGFVVLDPVMVAKNGAALLQPDIIDYLKDNLLSYATVITPNIPEAEKLLETSINSYVEMESAAKTLGEKFNINILLKGGHLNAEQSSDVLYTAANKKFHWFHAPKINTKNTHGTGCTLSSAIASYLAQGFELPKSIQLAKDYLTRALESGSKFNIGKGFGPVDHFYPLREKNYHVRKINENS
ncbi:MAG: bifunctional hydroxymethylpyrimidine kinase/phosphomethylpyrimidine kinase [Gammaproteobacteria bacterium]|nr:bifunctional hydroxymethylpyrimidine kinase/phosphomethylpyrimidine kinase [Gammaproteobacteria bacterium]